VRNSSEFDEVTNLDVKASVDALAGSASAHFNVDTQNTFDETSINVVVKAFTDYGWYGMEAQPLQLSDDAKALRDSDPKGFEETCGSRYVALEHRASSAGILISIANVRQSFKQKFEVDASANGGGLGMSGSASSKFSDELKTALTQNRVSFQVFSTGGDGFGSLGEVVKGLSGQSDPLSTITSGLANFLSTFGKKNAALYSFSVTSMAKFGWNESAVEPWSDQKETQLREIVRQYRRLTDALSNAQNFQAGGVWKEAVCSLTNCTPAFIQVLSDTTELQEQQQKLRDAYDSCKVSKQIKTCTIPAMPPAMSDSIRRFETPAPPEAPFLLTTLATPTTSQTLAGNEARAVLNAPANLRTQVLHQFASAADDFQVCLCIRGTYLDTMKLTYLTAKQFEAGSDDSVCYNPGEYDVFVEGKASQVIWSYKKDDRDGAITKIENWMAGFTKDGGKCNGSGTFYLIINDGLGRKFRLPLFDADFTSEGGKVTSVQETYDY
jgi:hypothetical protein